MFKKLKLLKLIFNLSDSVDEIRTARTIDDRDKAIVKITLVLLSLTEVQLHKDIVDDEKVKLAVQDLLFQLHQSNRQLKMNDLSSGF